ncbi:DNA internalization-related competence protein ComEC/Rec2 [Cohnella abietis]|uniref:Competence protein ComEC n=1 Tax=Cohnella abietis TaxID=2507935 RepID=A0A3T1D9K8_9BACL|nr:DNA internalization-related competence protein ComEC/Rec2 [Cohnella abietis]BBI34770.1 competence protein ComEC [Cohnella abietis]
MSLCQGLRAILVLGALILLLVGLGAAGKLSPRLALVCILALILASAERQWVELHKTTDIENMDATIGAEAILEGYISSVIEVDGDLATFKLKAYGMQLAATDKMEKLTDTVIVRIKLIEQAQQEVAASWHQGDWVRLTGNMELPDQTGNFGAFDYREFLNKHGIYWQMSIKGTDSVSLLDKPVPLTIKPMRELDRMRDLIGGLMDRLYPTGDSGYMKGLVVGIRSDLDPEQFDYFARLGLTHILAISGLHVGVVVYLLLQLGALLKMTRERTLDVTIAMLPFYMMITGGSPSAVRACLMAMIALWLARRHALKDGLHLLLAAALIMLIWNPSLIEEIGFQLSFIVTAGLILFVPTVTASLPIPWKWLRGPVAVTLTAQVVSFPLTAYYFHTFNLMSLPANFVLVPFISLIVLPLGMASIALGSIWLPLGIIPAKLATAGNNLTFFLVEWLNGYLGLRTAWQQVSLMWIVIAYLLMGLGIKLLKRRLASVKEREWWKKHTKVGVVEHTKEQDTVPLIIESVGWQSTSKLTKALKGAGIAVIVAAWLLWGYQPAWLNRNATVSFINVGQGDSILIRTGQGKLVLIDTGGTISFRKKNEEWKNRSDPYEVGRKLLVPLLNKRGIGKLDALVLTHLDADHIGGAKAVIENIPIRTLLFNGTIKNSPVVLSLFQLALNKNTSIYSVHEPMEWEIDSSTKIKVLYPTVAQAGSTNDIMLWGNQNARSVVLLVTVYGRSFLLSGDLEAEGEREIVEAELIKNNLNATTVRRVDVLKAGHHGSKTSTTNEWVDYWNPQDTIISVGLNNSYGHPYPAVMERLTASGTNIFRTDLNGEIQYLVRPNGAMERRMLRK